MFANKLLGNEIFMLLGKFKWNFDLKLHFNLDFLMKNCWNEH